MVRVFTHRAPCVVQLSVKPLHDRSRSHTAHANRSYPKSRGPPRRPVCRRIEARVLAWQQRLGRRVGGASGRVAPLRVAPERHDAPPTTQRAREPESQSQSRVDGASLHASSYDETLPYLPRARRAPGSFRRDPGARSAPPPAQKLRSSEAQKGMSTVAAAAGARPKLLPLSDAGANGASDPGPSAWLRVGSFGEWTANATISVL